MLLNTLRIIESKLADTHGLFGRNGFFREKRGPAFVGAGWKRGALPHHPKKRRALGGLRQIRPGHRRQHRPGARSGTGSGLFGGRGAAGRRAGDPARTDSRRAPAHPSRPPAPDPRRPPRRPGLPARARRLAGHAGNHAERTGFLRYTGGGVLFVGRDGSGQARHITKRAIDPGPDEQPKRDLAGSDKTYPPRCPATPAWSGSWRAASMPWWCGNWRSGAARPRPPWWSAAGPACAASWTTPWCKPCCCMPIR